MQMTGRIQTGIAMLLCVLCAWISPLFGQQTDNHKLHAVPPPGKMTIDGKLNDWDLSGQFDVYANARTRNSYSTRVAAMYDAEYLYLAIQWRDPTPMFNMVDARFDIGSGWRSDCLQLRLVTDMTMHVDCWYSTAAERAVINIAYGKFSGGRDKENDANLFEAIQDAMKVGALEAFQRGEDGKSYVQEIALPWKLITGQSAMVKATGKPAKPAHEYKPGDSFKLGMEFLWGGPDGKTWPVHRYADLLAEGHSSREFFWTAENAWGPVVLEPKGNLKLESAGGEESLAYLQKTEGPVKLEYDMPFDGFVTLVIEDEQGRRVRNLIGMAPRSKGRQIDFWDGADENGNLAAPGTYRWRGLYHQGIDPSYDASFGTPGTPPWDNADNSGAWLSDHNPPQTVAAGTDMMILAAGGSEAGYSLIGTDLEGRKKWSQRKFQGIFDIASDGTHAFLGMNVGSHGEVHRKHSVPQIGRCLLKTGEYVPFKTPAGESLEVPVATEEEKAVLTGIAVRGDTLAASLTGPDLVRFFDSNTMAKKSEVPVSKPRGLAFNAEGVLFVLSGTQVMKLVDGKLSPVVSSGLTAPADLTLDANGQIFVSDRATHQVKVFNKDGAFVCAIGTAGGRPQPGAWQPGGMLNPQGVAIDPKGQLWVAEEDKFPKRISVWTSAGELVKDFIGPTGYGGMGAFVDPEDETRVFGNGCEYRLDYSNNQATVVANLLNDDLVGDMRRFNGHEYVMTKRNELFLRKDNKLVRVALFGSLDQNEINKRGLPLTAPEKGRVNFLWNDRNDDGVMQKEEFATNFPHPLDNGYWGGYWLDEEFNLALAPGGYENQTVSVIPLSGFTPGGAPLWEAAKQKLVSQRKAQGPNKIFFAARDLIIAGSPMTAMNHKGEVLWTYKDNWPDVHGSHNAPIPERDDLLVGTLSCIGAAETNVGKVFGVNSNMGRLFLFTTDGLFLASVFQDVRIGPDPWPAEAKRGSPMGGVSMGGEWFGGYFFRAKKSGAYYLIAGGTSYNLLKLGGFETLKPLPAKPITFTVDDLAAAEKLQVKQAATVAGANQIALTSLKTPPVLDGNLQEFEETSRVQWSSGQYRLKGAAAFDAEHLYLAWEIQGDSNPLVNAGKDVTQLFITGDSVDLQLGTNPAADPKRTDPVAGDLRLLISVLDNKPVAVLYRWKTEAEKKPQTFSSPWRNITLESVQPLTDARIDVKRHGNGYSVEAAIPLKTLGFAPESGKEYKLDLGAVFSDANGNNRSARVYWSNKATGLVNDVPGEIMAQPNLWGTATVKK